MRISRMTALFRKFAPRATAPPRFITSAGFASATAPRAYLTAFTSSNPRARQQKSQSNKHTHPPLKIPLRRDFLLPVGDFARTRRASPYATFLPALSAGLCGGVGSLPTGCHEGARRRAAIAPAMVAKVHPRSGLQEHSQVARSALALRSPWLGRPPSCRSAFRCDRIVSQLTQLSLWVAL